MRSGEMFQVRWHGRAQQGVVSANQLLAAAAALEGKYVQAFPDFGPERGGAPIRSFIRISEFPIEIHEKVYEPEAVIIVDYTLFKDASTLNGIKKNGFIVLNTDYTPEELRKNLNLDVRHICTVDASKLAREIFKWPFYNTPMLGGFVRATEVIKLDSLIEAAGKKFSGKILELNLQAIRRGYEEAKLG